MGICKCKKRSEDFCFQHKKFICDSCIITDHPVCHIGSYVSWLNDSDFEEPLCGICKGDINSESSIRLCCYHLFHPECIDVFAASLPATTAQAGYACPKCNKPIIPSSDRTDPLAQSIRKAFSYSQWAEVLLGTSNKKMNGATAHHHQSLYSNTNGVGSTSPLDQQQLLQQQQTSPNSNNNNLSPTSTEFYTNGTDSVSMNTSSIQVNPSLLEETPPLSHLNNTNPYGLAIRKQQPQQNKDTVIQLDPSLMRHDDEEEDKYNKKTLLSLPDISKVSSSQPQQRLNTIQVDDGGGINNNDGGVDGDGK
eukprot:gene4294-5369_t